MRDLEKLQAARLPAPVPVQKAPVMDIPSSAAHTTNPPPFVPATENKPVAPFPDMGTGDVVDLTLGDKKPSPRVPPGSIKASGKPSPALRNEIKPSPKTAHKQTPKAMPPAKVTPVPPPQIPRLHPPQSIAGSQAAQPQPQSAPQRKQSASQSISRAPAAQLGQGTSLGSTLSLPSGGKPGDANAAGGELNFTDMQFTLAPSANESQNAPPAPMPEFDLTTFAPQDGNNDLLSMGNFSADGANANASGANGASNTTRSQAQKEAEKPDANLDDLFNLDNGSGGDNMDLDLDLGTGGATDSNFDELFSYTNDADMGQFDNAYFGLE